MLNRKNLFYYTVLFVLSILLLLFVPLLGILGLLAASLMFFLRLPFVRLDVIAKAESDDLINWRKEGIAVDVSLQDEMVYHPSVVQQNDFYRMYARGGNELDSIVSFISRDLKTWKREPGFRLKKDFRIRYPYALPYKGKIILYFTYYDGYSTQIGLTISRDGLNFDKMWKKLVRPPKGWFNPSAPSVSFLPTSSDFEMFFIAEKNGKSDIFKSSSKDGLKWSKPVRQIIRGAPQKYCLDPQFFDGLLFFANDDCLGVNLSSVSSGRSRRTIGIARKLKDHKWAFMKTVILPDDIFSKHGVLSPRVYRFNHKFVMFYTAYWGRTLFEPLLVSRLFSKILVLRQRIANKLV